MATINVHCSPNLAISQNCEGTLVHINDNHQVRYIGETNLYVVCIQFGYMVCYTCSSETTESTLLSYCPVCV